ncbi:MAG TPA: hypothetical protein VJ835_09705 [Fimbriimonadaceae bacterium]|nr:hypothetical protein [Fimbriimonadaceae bacterium]
MMNSRLIVAGTAWLAIASVFGQDASPKITYKTVAVPVQRALDEIGKQAGLRLTASPAVNRDIVIVSVQTMPLTELKAQLAKALSARWEAAEGGEALVADTVVRRQEEQKERAEYTAALAKSLKELVESLNPPKVDPKSKETKEEAAARMQMSFMLGGGAPGRATIKLMQLIGATNLAAIDEKSRVVYSSNPNRMQRPLPNGANAILAQAVADYNQELIKRQRERSEHPIPEDERMKKLREMFGDFGEEKPIEGTPSKAILVCARQPFLGGLTVNLKIYNEQGKVVVNGSQMLSAGGAMFDEMVGLEFGPDGLPKPKSNPNAPANEKAIEFSATTKELAEMSNVMTMSSSPTKMSDELRAKLLNPEQYDPLSFRHSEALIAIAGQRKKNLVAVLPDTMESMMGMMMPKGEALLPSAYLESIKGKVEVTDAGQWIIARPTQPADSRANRIDRVALGTFLRTVTAKGAVTLDDLAAYAQRSNSPMEDQATFSYFMIFAPNAVQSGMGGQVSWDMLRFYGAMSPTQKRSLSEGGRLAIAQMNPTQTASLRQMAFGPETNLYAKNPNAKKPDFEMPSFLRGALFGQFGGDYRSEPTEVMPNGLPAEGYLEMKLTQDKVAKPTGNIPAMFGNAVLGPDELAMLKMFKEMPGMEQAASFMPTIDEVRLGDRTVYDFTFTVADGVTLERSLNDDRMSANSPVYKMSNLPADFSKKIDERMAAFKKIPFFDPAFFQGGNRGTPPPAN